MEINKQMTLAQIVNQMHRAAGLFEKYQLDFCCKGKRPLEEACREKNIPVDDVVDQLRELNGNGATLQESMFQEMSAEQLIQYIELKHHFYVKQSMPTIYGHVQRVAYKHGDRFPYMVEVADLFAEVCEELNAHLQKEEMILFPRIKDLEKVIHSPAANFNADLGYITAPINMMEMEHEHAGDLLARINELTNGFSIPLGACNTFRVSLAELKEFEEDLHQHVHLENNILFPKAIDYLKQAGQKVI